MNDVVGSAAFELRATKDKLGQDIKSAEKDLKGFGDKAANDIDGSAGKIGASIGRMATVAVTAVAALVAVIGVAVIGAFNLSFGAIRMADDIAKSAARIGIGTDALQEWRHVATQTGAAAADADTALDRFATKLAQATAGTNKQASGAFNLLGIGPEQLRQFESTEDAIDHITDQIKGLKSEADRAAVTEALGLGPLSNALRDGAVDVAALRDEARELGIVMDAEMIQRASKAQGEFDTLSQIIDVNLKSAFIDLAPVLLTAIGLIADLARTLSDALDQWRDLDSKTGRGLNIERSRLIAERDAITQDAAASDGRVQPLEGRIVRAVPVAGVDYRPLTARETGSVLARSAPNLPSAGNGNPLNPPQYIDAGEHFDALNRRIAAVDAERSQRSESNRPPPRTDRPDGGTINQPTTAPRRATERAARVVDLDRIRAELDMQNALDLARASGDETAIRAAEEKLDIARLTAAFERAGYKDAAFRATTQVAAMNEALAKAEAKKKADEDAVKLAEAEVEARERAAELLDMQLSDQIELARLSGDEGLLKSLLREEEIRRRIIDLMKLTPGLTEDAARTQATATTDARDSADRTGKMREEFRHAFTDGIQAAIDGDLGSFFENLADRFTTRMLDNLADDLFDLLSEAAKGMGSKDGGGWLAAIGSAIFGGGRASGGPMTGGNWYRVGEHGPENIVMPRDGFAIPNGGMGGQGGQARPQRIFVEVDLRSEMLDARIDTRAAPMAQAAEARAIRTSSALARRAAPGVQQQQRRLGTT